MVKSKSDVVELIAVICLAVFVVVFLISCILVFNEPFAATNKQLKERMAQFDGQAEYPLASIIPFEWDIAYSFDKGTTKKEIEEVIGHSLSCIKDVPNSEDVGCYVFMYKGKISTYVCGSHKELGYKFDFPKENGTYGMVKNNMFSVFFTNDTKGYVELSQDWQKLYELDLS